MILSLFCLILAMLCFVLAACGVSGSPRTNLIAVGLAAWVAAQLAVMAHL
jgi:hypothetical protein